MLNRKIIFFVLLLLILVAFFLKQATNKSDSPEEVVKNFTNQLFKVAPPDLKKEAIDFVYSKISKNSQKKIKSLGDIATFLRSNFLPEKGFEIIKVKKDDKTAIITVKWAGKSNVVFKKFFMILEGGQWKIDSITNSKI